MGKPKLGQLREDTFAFLWKGRDEISTSNTSAITYRPRLILEAIKKSTEHISHVGFERLLVYLLRHFGAKFGDAVAGSLPDRMVVSLTLLNVECAYFLSVLADHLLALVSMHLLPGVIRVDLNTFSNVVSIQTHSWHKKGVVLLPHCFIVLTNCKVASASLG
jgi:hypothetical protein